MADACLTPPASCQKWLYQSTAEQRYLLMQLLNALLDSPRTLSELKDTDSAGYICNGSTSQQRMLQAQMIATGLADAVTAQPTCWTAQQLEGAISYLVCELLAQIA